MEAVGVHTVIDRRHPRARDAVMMRNLPLTALRVGDDHRRLAEYAALEGQHHTVERTEMQPATGQYWERPTLALQPFPMHPLPGTIDMLAKSPIITLHDGEIDTSQRRAHHHGKAERSEGAGCGHSLNSTIRYAFKRLARRRRLRKEMHPMALRHKPLDQVGDLALATAVQAKGAFDQADLHRRCRLYRGFS